MTPPDLGTWRQSLGWTQATAATWLRVSLRTYQAIEVGRRPSALMGPISRAIDLLRACSEPGGHKIIAPPSHPRYSLPPNPESRL
jgi:hypothetical protein